MKERRPHVLIVEDDFDVSEGLREALELQGYDVTSACNGAQALFVLDGVSDGRPSPAMIVLDLGMPVMSGREFRARQLERHAGVAAIPVVGWTGFGHADVDFPVFTKGGGELARLLAHILAIAGPASPPRRPRFSTRRLSVYATVIAGLVALAKAIHDLWPRRK